MESGIALRIHQNERAVSAYAGYFVSRGEGIHPVRRFDCHALFYVSRGTMGMFEGDRRFDLKEGDALLLRAGETHGGTAPYPPDLRLYWLNFQVKAMHRGRFQTEVEIPQRSCVRRGAKMVELFRFFLDDRESGEMDDDRAHYLVMLILDEMRRGRDPLHEESRSDLVDRAQSFIASRCHEPITTSVIAGALKCNADYLSRIYKRTTGVTVIEDIHRKRVHLAKKKLLEGDMSVAEIAYNCGFENCSYFHRVFKNVAGMTPGAYRVLHGRMFVDTR